MEKFNPGDTVPIEIGERKILTVIDKHGTQRLPTNPVYRDLLDSGALHLNELAVAYFKNKISEGSYLEFYLNIGYSVCGFSELSAFEEYEIKNPVWKI